MNTAMTGWRRIGHWAGALVLMLAAAGAEAAPGALDPAFNAGSFTSQFFTRRLDALAAQPDGKILVGGQFNEIGGVPRNGLARLNADGTLDASFVPPPFLQSDLVTPRGFALQPDGKIVVVGSAFAIGSTRYSVIRLNADGSLDPSFALSPIDGTVYAVVLQPDGRLVIGGDFRAVANTARPLLARLNANGTLDPSFDVGTLTRLSGTVHSAALQSDGKVVAGGAIELISGTTTLRNVIRVAASGAPDLAFRVAGDALDRVLAVAVDPAGRIYVGGSHSSNIGSRNALTRLLSDGTVDASFTSAVTGPEVAGIALEPGGKVLAVGNFCTTPLEPGCAIARLKTDGSRDDYYPRAASNCAYAGPDDTPVAVVRQRDGNVLIGGSFTTISCTPRERVARLIDDPGLTIDSVTRSEGQSGTTPFVFTVRLSAPATQTVIVGYATADVSATAASDYVATTGALTFAPGETAKTVPVLVNGDSTPEPDETFRVVLAGAVNATIVSGIGTGTILNDDACLYTVSPLTVSLASAASAGNALTVTTTATCSYTAIASAGWLVVSSGATGTGSGTVTYSALANTGPARNATVVVGGSTVNVSQAGAPLPPPAKKTTAFDYDGDGKADIGIYRPGTGTWFVLQSTQGFLFRQWGFGNDKVVSGDFDGDGKADVAIYRPSNGTWYILQSRDGFKAVQWGLTGDIPVPADYDGDGKADFAIYRPSNGTWYALGSRDGFISTQFGLGNDVPAVAE